MKEKPITASESNWLDKFKAPGKRIKLNADVMPDADQATEIPLWVYHGFTNAKALMREGSKQQAGRQRGNEKAVKTNQDTAAKWIQPCIKRAHALLKEDVPPRKLAERLSEEFPKSADRIRRVLKEAGVT